MPTLLWPNGLSTIPATSSEYGMRFHPIEKRWKLHAGIDEVGYTTVCSPVEGVIVFAGYSGGFGNLVKVRETSTGDEHWLAHNARFLRTSGAVSPGTPLAIMGTTGASTGIHSHHEVHLKSGGTVNPRSYYAGRGASASGGGSASTGGLSMAEIKEITDKLDQVLQALGAHGLTPGGWPDTIMGNTREIESQVNGLPDALKAIMAQVNGVPEVLADIRKRIGVSDAQVQVIADAVVKQIGKPTVTIDYAAIAKAVNDDAARRYAS